MSHPTYNSKTGTAGQRASAFTLIELLVVIAIISLLVSILMPSLKQAKDLAENVVCATNLRNIGLGSEMYINEFDSWMTVEVESTSPTVSADWPMKLYPYVVGEQLPAGNQELKNVKNFLCPAVDLVESCGFTRDTATRDWYVHYRYNGQFRTDTPKPGEIYSAANVITFADTLSANLFAFDWEAWPDRIRSNPGNSFPPYYYIPTRHKDAGCNFLFADSHAEWQAGESEYTYHDDGTYNGLWVDHWSYTGT